MLVPCLWFSCPVFGCCLAVLIIHIVHFVFDLVSIPIDPLDAIDCFANLGEIVDELECTFYFESTSSSYVASNPDNGSLH
jgi:hypothetical protein